MERNTIRNKCLKRHRFRYDASIQTQTCSNQCSPGYQLLLHSRYCHLSVPFTPSHHRQYAVTIDNPTVRVRRQKGQVEGKIIYHSKLHHKIWVAVSFVRSISVTGISELSAVLSGFQTSRIVMVFVGVTTTPPPFRVRSIFVCFFRRCYCGVTAKEKNCTHINIYDYF